jgi:hypothetical protein
MLIAFIYVFCTTHLLLVIYPVSHNFGWLVPTGFYIILLCSVGAETSVYNFLFDLQSRNLPVLPPPPYCDSLRINFLVQFFAMCRPCFLARQFRMCVCVCGGGGGGLASWLLYIIPIYDSIYY